VQLDVSGNLLRGKAGGGGTPFVFSSLNSRSAFPLKNPTNCVSFFLSPYYILTNTLTFPSRRLG
jgi:hypothetical protein